MAEKPLDIIHKSIEEAVLIELKGGREFRGILKGYDIHMNLVLKDAEELDSFYFDLLLNAAKRWDKQNPKRIVCECYITLLDFEGRLYEQESCFICEQRIEDDIALMQAFKPVHPACIYGPALPTKKILDFFESKKTVFLEDFEVEYVYDVVMKGL